MKKLLAKSSIVALAVLLVVGVAFADINVVIGSGGKLSSSTSGADFVNSEVDTVKWILTEDDVGLTAASLGIEWDDSVSVGLVTMRRIYDGTVMPLLLGDTLTAFTSYSDLTAASEPNAKAGAIVLAPLAEQYWFIVTYAASNNGVTSATCKYKIIKTLSPD